MNKDMLYNELSIVIPVYNSEATISELISRIEKTCQGLGINFEIIAVDDASSDTSWKTLSKTTKTHPRLQCIRLAENCGQANATMAGIHHCTGKYVVTIDDDLQYNPEDIQLLYNKMSEGGYEVVCGYTAQKQHKEIYTLIVRLTIFFLRRLYLPRLKKVRLFSSFKIYRRSLFFNNDNSKTSYHIFHLWKHRANESASINVQHNIRNTGKSGYGFLKLITHFKIAIIYMFKMTSLFLTVLFMLTGLILYCLSTPLSNAYFYTICVLVFLYASFAFLLINESKPTYTISEVK